MAYTQDEALELARSFLITAAKKYRVHAAYLFGSYAKGIPKEYSDIDLSIIIPIKRFYKESVNIFHEAQEFNSLLEVICFRKDEFDNNDMPLVTKIKKEGIKIV